MQALFDAVKSRLFPTGSGISPAISTGTVLSPFWEILVWQLFY